MTVTRLSKEGEQIKKLKVKRKSIPINNNLSVYEFNDFDNYIELCNYIYANTEKNTYNKLKKSKLYKLDSKYYLVLNIADLSLENFKKIHCSIIEFGKHISDSDLFERKLIEYGLVIFKTNAFEKCMKAFLK